MRLKRIVLSLENVGHPKFLMHKSRESKSLNLFQIRTNGYKNIWLPIAEHCTNKKRK